MTLIIAGHVIDPEGTALVGVDVLITFDNAASFADLAGDWDTQGRYGLSIPTDTFGAWSWTVPFSAIDPSNTTCSITLPNGVRWSGLLPLSHNGTLSLKDLKDSYSWGLVSAPSASVVAVQGIAGTSLPGVTSDGQTPGGIVVAGKLAAAALASGAPPAALAVSVLDPSYQPTLIATPADVATVDSHWGVSVVHFLTWAPTISGDVSIISPTSDGISEEIDVNLYVGTVAGTDYPSLDGSGTNFDQPTQFGSFFLLSGAQRGPNPLTVVAGTTYTIVIQRFPPNYDAANIAAIGGVALPIGRIIQSLQTFGGIVAPVVWRPVASGPASDAEGYGTTATVFAAHSEGHGTLSSAIAAHSEGQDTIATHFAAHAEGEGTTSTGYAAHAEGGRTLATDHGSHAEGFLTKATKIAAHAEGVRTTADALGAHAEGDSTQALAHASHVEGLSAIARLTAEHAHSSGNFANVGDAQYSRLVVMQSTTDATPGTLLLDFGDLPVPAGQTWTVIASIAATREDIPGTVAGWVMHGLVSTANGTLRVVGTPTVDTWHDADAAAWEASLAVSGANLTITVTGAAATSIRWIGTVQATCVGV